MFTLPNLPYAYNALEPYIDEKTMMIHHDKHHAAYVKNVNDALAGHADLLVMPIEQLLMNLSKVPEDIRTKVRNNGGGHANHTLFWEIMTPASVPLSGTTAGKPGGALAKAIDKAFGSFATFQEQFTAKGMGRFGSGWAWMVKEKDGSVFLTDTPNQDTPVMDGKTPILGLDVWEHAYYLKYQNMRADYIKNWWNVVNWDVVAKRYEAS